MDNVCSFNGNPFSAQTSGTCGRVGTHSVELCRAFQIPATTALVRLALARVNLAAAGRQTARL
jgi:hypothetical protein